MSGLLALACFYVVQSIAAARREYIDRRSLDEAEEEIADQRTRIALLTAERDAARRPKPHESPIGYRDAAEQRPRLDAVEGWVLRGLSEMSLLDLEIAARAERLGRVRS